MMCGITGTPGTGKSQVGRELLKRGHTVVSLNATVGPYVIGDDEERDAKIIDVDRWAAEFVPMEGYVEGHLAHLLPCDRIVVLRCRPDELRKRLSRREYRQEKIQENAEAEALDVCLIETVENFEPSQILELDTTALGVASCAGIIEGFVNGTVPADFGHLDWSGFLEIQT